MDGEVVMSESTEQQAVIQWFRYQHPNYRLISIPNGQMVGGRNKFALLAKYKAEGMTNGVSDLFLCVSRRGYHGLWLEMKDMGKGEKSLSKDQQLWLADMHEQGYRAEWAAGFEQAKEIITNYLN
jgi:hypothetical protein